VVKGLGITVLPPDINKSGRQFSVDGEKIRFGMAAVKNVGGAVVDEIVAERESGGLFTGFRDFCRRMAGRKVNKRVVENLIRAGAFDGFGLKRAVLMNEFEKVLDDAVKEQKTVIPGQMDMFASLMTVEEMVADNFPDCEEFPERDILAMEKEAIGMYVSGHPLNQYRELASQVATAEIYEISENEDGRFNIGSQVRLAGIINRVRNQLTKKGEIMKYLELEDLTGTMEVLVFPSLVRKFDSLLREDSIVAISGNLDMAEDAPPKLRLETLCLLTDCNPQKSAENAGTKLYLRLMNREREEQVKAILRGGDGDIPVILRYEDTKQTMMAGKSMWVSLNDGREEQLTILLGAENVKLVEK